MTNLSMHLSQPTYASTLEDVASALYFVKTLWQTHSR